MTIWFGDPDLKKNLEGDDYFARQDLDIDFRNNSIEENLKNISLVNKYGKGKKLIICSTAPKNVVKRIIDVGFDSYWWAPLVDNPEEPDSLTRKMVEETKLPAMNTGGTVGTAAWVFALTQLKIPKIAVVGMSRHTAKAAHFVPKYLTEQGFDITPVNPNSTEILGKKSYPDVSSIDHPVDIVDIFRPSEDVLPFVEDAIKKKPKVIWLQEGIHNSEAEELARSNGIMVIFNRCMLAEHQRLF